MLNLNPYAAPMFIPGRALSIPIAYFNDFITGVTEDGETFSTTADKGEFLVSADTLDAATQNPAIQDDQDGGVIKTTTDATSGERIAFQLNGENFFLTRGRSLYFEARMKFTNTTQDAVFGLSVNTTDPHASAPSDYVLMGLTGDADIQYGTATGSSDSGAFSGTDSTTDLVANTWTVFAFMFDGVDAIRFYVDGVEVGVKTTNIPYDKYLSPVFCVESNGAAEALFLDYVLVANERGR